MCIQWGQILTTSTNSKLIKLPISFNSSKYFTSIIHEGTSPLLYAIKYGYITNSSFEFIVTENTGKTSPGWLIKYVCIGY